MDCAAVSVAVRRFSERIAKDIKLRRKLEEMEWQRLNIEMTPMASGWTPSTHYALAGSVPIIFWNAGGMIFYTDALDLSEDLLALGSIELARQYMEKFGARLATRTLLPALVRVSRLAATARVADGARFQQHLGIAGFLAVGGVL